MSRAAGLAALVLAVTPACRSMPEPIPRSAAEGALTAETGLPAEWRPWIGFDDWATPPPVDWREYLTADSDSRGVFAVSAPSEGCVFEVVHREGSLLRRWHVLLRVGGGLPTFQWLTLTVDEHEAAEERDIPVLVPFRAVTVAVAPEGQSPGPARESRLPTVSFGLDYTVGARGALDEALAALQDTGAATREVRDRYFVALCKPATTLLALFEGIQEHAELSAILLEVVDAPGLLDIVLNGGLKLTLRPDLSATEPCDCPIGSSATRPGARFPATLLANGEAALEMEIFAVPSARPVHLSGGLVGLRAWRPGDEENSVELRIIGARRLPTGEAASPGD